MSRTVTVTARCNVSKIGSSYMLAPEFTPIFPTLQCGFSSVIVLIFIYKSLKEFL